MKSNPTMHLPKENENDPSHPVSSTNFDLESLLSSISDDTAATTVTPAKNVPIECPECRRRGELSYIRPFQLNFQEAMYLCPNRFCSYPMKEDKLVDTFIFKREAASITDDSKGLSDKTIRPSHDHSMFFDGLNGDSAPKQSELNYDTTIPHQIVVHKDEVFQVKDSKSVITPDRLEKRTMDCSTGQSVKKNAPTESEDLNLESIVMGEESNQVGHQSDDNSHECTDSRKPLPSFNLDDAACDIEHFGVHFRDSETAGDQPMDTTGGESTQESQISEPDINERSDSYIASGKKFYTKMIQWTNERNSCWLDAIMQVLMCSNNIRAAVNAHNFSSGGIWKEMIRTYDESQKALNDPFSCPSNSKIAVSSLTNNLNFVRQLFFNKLVGKTQLDSWDFQSLTEMFPLSLKLNSEIESLFTANLLWHFQCDSCMHQRARRSAGLMVSLPDTMDHFHPLHAQFKKSCYECKSPNATTTIWMEQLPPCLVFHFQKGLPHSNLRVLDFAILGQLYCVYAVVQYVTEPSKHFICWIRDTKTERWLRCDDLANPICEWIPHRPKIPPQQIHMVFWERKLPCSVQHATKDIFAPITNEEAVALGLEIPVEHFFAHEEETIVIAEDETSKTDQENRISGASQSEMLNESALEISNVSDMMTEVPEHLSGQTEAYGATPLTTISNPPISSGIVNNTIQSCPRLSNGGLTMIPSSDGTQMIQIMAPANACSIYIIPKDSQIKQSVYLVPHNAPRVSATPALQSFVDNPHSYNMVAQTITGSAHHSGERLMMSKKRVRRQYRLSGYSKRLDKSCRFSPMKACKPYSSAKAPETMNDAVSERSCNSKEDSETQSEISESSDVLLDYGAYGSGLSSLVNSATFVA